MSSPSSDEDSEGVDESWSGSNDTRRGISSPPLSSLLETLPDSSSLLKMMSDHSEFSSLSCPLGSTPVIGFTGAHQVTFRIGITLSQMDTRIQQSDGVLGMINIGAKVEADSIARLVLPPLGHPTESELEERAECYLRHLPVPHLK